MQMNGILVSANETERNRYLTMTPYDSYKNRGRRSGNGGGRGGDGRNSRDGGRFSTPDRPRVLKASEELRTLLLSIDRKSYPAYKSLAGIYRFPGFQLSIDHVQGDPFASPSHLSVFVPHKTAGFDNSLYSTGVRKTALEDYLIRQFGKEAARFNFQAKGSGKSGLISVTRCGQEILSRTACEICEDGIWLRFHAGFPANGRTINARELEKILFDFIPSCVKKSLVAASLPADEAEKRAELADDQEFIRNELERLNLAAFVADDSILPRQSGVSDLPLKGCVPFQSPASLRIQLSLPHKGLISGMGIPKGITLIAGGGYHGKSTLLKALEMGVYNHISGDGREYVITDSTAVKLRAEDGRYIEDTDISLFINDLPNGKDTCHFTTEDASGSTSQAAGIVEGMFSGCRTFLIDEDTCAANFMVRDELMQQVIHRKKEPITPFIERARQLFEQCGISTILVAGSSGAFFHIADTVIQMDSYHPVDITGKVRETLNAFPSPLKTQEDVPAFCLPELSRPYQVNGKRLSDAKIKCFDRDSFSIDKNMVNLHYVEQIADSEQTAALAYILRYACSVLADGSKSIAQIADALEDMWETDGFSSFLKKSKGGGFTASGFARPRKQEVCACLARYRK